MYQEFFNLKEKPFSLSPDPRFFYLTPQHKESLAKCQYAVTNKSGLAVVYGDVGTGKTTIARMLYQQFSDQKEGDDRPLYAMAMIINPKLKSDMALLRAVMREFGATTARSFEQSLANFREFLTEQYDQNKGVILIVDEAQNLEGGRKDMFELLRMLSNYETNTEKLIQIILFGQMELATKIDKRRGLKSRIAQFGALTPLTEEDANEMIKFRWQVAGGDKLPFTDKALKAIFKYSQGLPREINKLCDTALLKAFAQEKKVVNVDLIDEAAKDIRLTEEEEVVEEVKPKAEPKRVRRKKKVKK